MFESESKHTTYNVISKIIKLKEISKGFTSVEGDLEMLFRDITFDADESSGITIEGITPDDIRSDINTIMQIRKKYTRGFVKAINNI